MKIHGGFNLNLNHWAMWRRRLAAVTALQFALIGIGIAPAQAAISVSWDNSKTYSFESDSSITLSADYVTHSSNNSTADGTFSSVGFSTSTAGCQIVSGVLSLTSSATRSVTSCSVVATVAYSKKTQQSAAKSFSVSWPVLPELSWSGNQYYKPGQELDLSSLVALANASGAPSFSLPAGSECSLASETTLLAPDNKGKCRVTASFDGATSVDREFYFLTAAWDEAASYSFEAGDSLSLTGKHSASDGSSTYGTALSIGDSNSANCSISGSALAASRAGDCDVVATHLASGATATRSITVTGSSGDFAIRWGAGPFEFVSGDSGLTPQAVLSHLILPAGVTNATAQLSLPGDSLCSLDSEGNVLRAESGHCLVEVTVVGSFAGNANASASHSKSYLAYESQSAPTVANSELEYLVAEVSSSAKSIRSLVASLTGFDEARLTGFTRASSTESRSSFRCTIDSLGLAFVAKAKQICVINFTVTKSRQELYRELNDGSGTVTIYVFEQGDTPTVDFMSRNRTKITSSPVLWGGGSELALNIEKGRTAHPAATLSYQTSNPEQCSIEDELATGEQIVSILEDATAPLCSVVADVAAFSDRVNLVKHPEAQASLDIQVKYAASTCIALDGFNSTGIVVEPLGGAYFLIDKTEPAREQDEQFPIDLNYVGYRVSGQSGDTEVSISNFAAESNRRNVKAALQAVGATTVSGIESGAEAYFTITPVEPLKVSKTNIPQSHVITVSTPQGAVLHQCKFAYSGIRESDPHSSIAASNSSPLVNRIVSIEVTDNTREEADQQYLYATVVAESNQIIRRSANNTKDFWNLSPAARVSSWPTSGVTMVSSTLKFGNMDGDECVIANPGLSVNGGIEYRLSRGEAFGYDCVQGDFRFKVASSLIAATLAEGIQVESVSHVQAGGELDHSRQRVANHKWGYRTVTLDDESQSKTYNGDEQDFYVDIDRFGACAQSMTLPGGLQFWSPSGTAPWTHVLFQRTWVGESRFEVAAGPCEDSPLIQEVVELDFTVTPKPIGLQFWAFDKYFDDTTNATMLGMNLHGHFSQDNVTVHQKAACTRLTVRFTDDDPASGVPIMVSCERAFPLPRVTITDANVTTYFEIIDATVLTLSQPGESRSEQYRLAWSLPMPANIMAVTPTPTPTPTPTASPTPTPTPTPTASPTPTPTPTPTASPTPTPTASPTPTPTPTPSNIAAPENRGDSGQRTAESMAQEVIGGFAPQTGIAIEVTGTRTVGQFVITPAVAADPVALAAALAESTARNATNFAQIQNVAAVAQAPKFTDADLPKVDEKVLKAFAESGLAAPKGLDMSQVSNAKNWLKIDALASDFKPGSLVYLTVTSEPILLGFAQVGENGSSLVSGYLPLEVLPEGGHNIRIVGTRSFDGIFADENGEIQLSEEALTEIQKFDPGTKATVMIEGESTSGGSVTAMREVLLHKDVPWWTVWLAAVVALLALLSLLIRKPAVMRRKNITAVVALVAGIPAFWLGWTTYSYEVMFLGSAIAAIAALFIAGPAVVWAGIRRVFERLRSRAGEAKQPA